MTVYRYARGFTLLELLVVLIVIAVLAGTVLLTYTGSDRDRTLLANAERLMLVIEQARSEALLRNEVWLLRIDQQTYAFSRLDRATEEWYNVQRTPFSRVTLGVDSVLTGRSLAQENGRTRTGGEELEDVDARSASIVIYPTGETTPFDLRLRSNTSGRVMMLRSDGIQRVQLRQIGTADDQSTLL